MIKEGGARVVGRPVGRRDNVIAVIVTWLAAPVVMTGAGPDGAVRSGAKPKQS